MMTMANKVADLLKTTFKAPLHIDDEEHLGGNRSRVVRFRVRSPDGEVPRSVVIKHALAQEGETYDPEAAGGPAERLFNDWAGLQFLSEVLGASSPAPQFYAGDRTTGFIVMEDLGAGFGLHSALLDGNAARAEDAMVAYFRVLGRMPSRVVHNWIAKDGPFVLRSPMPVWYSSISRCARDLQSMRWTPRWAGLPSPPKGISGMSTATITTAISHVSLVTIQVRDQDAALRFYTECLGFEKTADAPFGEGMRWVTVKPAGAQTELTLITDPMGGAPLGTNTGVVLETDDIDAAYQELSSRGVHFTKEPSREFFGGWAEFVDQDGNGFGLHSNQPSE